MAEGQTFDIPEGGLEWFKDKMAKLAKRADKLTGAKLFMTVVGYHREEDRNSKFYNHKIYEVFVAFPEPKLNGWEFVAQIDHANEIGNIIRSIGTRELPDRYRGTDPICEHCGYKRRRRDTFVVFHEEDGIHRQVGRSCLKDFLGHGDAEKWAKVAELIAGIGEIARTSYGMGYSGALEDRRWFDTEAYCAAAAQAVLDKGWISRKLADERGMRPTSAIAWDIFYGERKISQEALELAEKALDHARTADQRGEMSDYVHNCYVVANSEAMEHRSAGIAASIVGVYYQNNRRKAATGVSAWQGTPGQRIEKNVTLEIVSACVNGSSVRHVFKDDAGNVYLWFASGDSLGAYRGKDLRIKARVKAHNEFRGVKQTLVNHVKVVEVFDDKGVPASLSQCAMYG